VGDLKHFADYLIITYIELTLFIFKNNSYILKKITFADCPLPFGRGNGGRLSNTIFTLKTDL